jgi:polysaccharide chain length determinant protein (PEP-CTERM system associated)
MLTPNDVLRIAARRKWQIILPFIVVAIAVAAYSWRLPNLYKSDTLILVVPQRIPESYIRSTVTANIEDRLRSISEQILSRTRLEGIIRDFGLYVEERQRFTMEEVVGLMRSQIKVDTVRGDSFKVTFTSGDPKVAQKVTERLSLMYIDENLRDREKQANGTNEFIEEQLETARLRLVGHEKKLEEYRMRYSGELPSQLQANVQMIQSSRAQLQAISESIDRDRDRRMALEKSVSEAGPADEPAEAGAPSVPAPIQEVETARKALTALELRLKPEHPDVIAARRQLTRLEQKADEYLKTADQPAARVAPASDAVRRTRQRQMQGELDRLDKQIRDKEAEVARLTRLITEYQARVDAVPSRETELTELTRDYRTIQDVYTSLLTKKEESKLAANLERAQAGEQFKVLDPARVPERPFSPNRPRMNLLGALFGLALGIALAGYLEYRDTSFRFEDEIIRFLALPVIALVPSMETAVEQRSRRRRVLFACAATLVLVAAATAAAWKSGALQPR